MSVSVMIINDFTKKSMVVLAAITRLLVLKMTIGGRFASAKVSCQVAGRMEQLLEEFPYLIFC